MFQWNSIETRSDSPREHQVNRLPIYIHICTANHSITDIVTIMHTSNVRLLGTSEVILTMKGLLICSIVSLYFDSILHWGIVPPCEANRACLWLMHGRCVTIPPPLLSHAVEGKHLFVQQAGSAERVFINASFVNVSTIITAWMPIYLIYL